MIAFGTDFSANRLKPLRPLMGLGLLSVCLLSAYPAYAQFEDLVSETISAQQENVNNLTTGLVGGGVNAILSEDQLEAITEEALLQTAQQQTGGDPYVEALGGVRRSNNSSRIDVDRLLEDFENTRDLLGEHGARSAYERSASDRPLPLSVLESIKKENVIVAGEGLPFDIRKEALKEAAISYGARGGLAWRSFAISEDLTRRSRYLDRVFDFGQLLIPAPSGLMIEPPIISESVNSMLIEIGGQEAAVSDRIYNIINNARIVSAPRTWRTYLERAWPAVEPPPDVLRPETEEERQVWIELVNIGWQEGVQQADDIFQDDLQRLLSEFRGMVRYRLLLSQGMISAPYALQVDRGVTGDGHEMRVGDRAVQITGMPQLITGASRWKPASR